MCHDNEKLYNAGRTEQNTEIMLKTCRYCVRLGSEIDWKTLSACVRLSAWLLRSFSDQQLHQKDLFRRRTQFSAFFGNSTLPQYSDHDHFRTCEWIRLPGKNSVIYKNIFGINKKGTATSSIHTMQTIVIPVC